MPRSGRIALSILGVHLVLQFFPPIPPDVRGSLWSHLLAFAFLVAGGIAVSQSSSPLLTRWSGWPQKRRAVWTLLALAAVGLLGSAVYLLHPALFTRFSGEEGIWEPLSTICYLASAILLYKVSRAQETSGPRRHLLFMSGLYLFLFLEEINYLEIFGGALPRIEGHYLGAAHDVVNLWAKNVISPAALAIIVVILLLLAFILWRLRFIQPLVILRDFFGQRGFFFVLGCVFIVIALSIEALYIPWRDGVQKPEELFELLGAICLSYYAVDLAASHRVDTPSRLNP